MKNPVKIDQPIYLQFIQTITLGFNLLGKEAQDEIKSFVSSQQLADGVFSDRAGRPDLYYSLFGFWLSSALRMKDNLKKLLSAVALKDIAEESKLVDQYALMLIQLGLYDRKKDGPNLFRMLLRRGYPINFSYQLFLFLLVFDARYGKKRWLYFLARLALPFYKPPQGSPASLWAALLVARQQLGMNVAKNQQQLLHYFEDNNGFKSFRHMETGDLLSTAVSLFALKTSGFDMRLIAPTCLDLVQQNYERGAFLSGDGDQTRDLEYTFYGLLVLGSLADNDL